MNRLVVVFLLFLSGFSFAQSVTIGKQVWMTKNLEVSVFRNGDLIPQARTDSVWISKGENGQPAWCYYYYDQNYNYDPANEEKYGKLYNWYAVNDPRGLAPEGWHIPSDSEWTELADFLGGTSSAGMKMKKRSGWSGGTGGNNSSGFSAMTTGCRLEDGAFYYLGYVCHWWSSTEYSSSSAWVRTIKRSEDQLRRHHSVEKEEGYSVRCIKD